MAHIKAPPPLKRLSDKLQSFTGCGPVVTATPLSDVPEFGRLTGKEIAALVGLAPINRESGKMRGRSTTGFGRPGVR